MSINYSKEHLKDRLRKVEEILALPAAACHNLFMDYTVRGDIEGIQWKEEMIRDPGVPYTTLHDIWLLTDKRTNPQNY